VKQVHTVVAVLFALVAVFVVFCAGGETPTALSEFPLDDAWIHLVYVRSLWTEFGLNYNPGIPEAGFSSMLWLLVSLPGFALSTILGVSPVLASKFTGLFFSGLAAWGAHRLMKRLEVEPMARMIACVLLVIAPGTAFASVSGMEVTLAMAAVLWTTDAAMQGRALRAGVLLGLAGLARPETAVLVGPLCVWFLRSAVPRGSSGRLRFIRALCSPVGLRSLAGLCVPPALMALPWLVYCHSVSGHWLPNTFYIKAGHAALGAKLELYVSGVVLQYGWTWPTLAACCWLAGLARAARVRSRATVLIAVVQLVGLAATLFVVKLDPGVAFFQTRYFTPFMGLGWVIGGLGIQEIWSRVSSRVPPCAAVGALGAAAVLLTVPSILDARDSYVGHCHDVYVLHTEPALQLAASVPPEVVVAVEGAGAARFHGGHFTVDLLGLNYWPLAHVDPASMERACLLAGYRPGLVLVPGAWLPALSDLFELTPIREYVVEEWSVVGGTTSRRVVAARSVVRQTVAQACPDLR
jgi:hypothetical protein